MSGYLEEADVSYLLIIGPFCRRPHSALPGTASGREDMQEIDQPLAARLKTGVGSMVGPHSSPHHPSEMSDKKQVN